MREPVIGIDLGTTYSAVATVEDGKPRVIPNRSGARLTPSMIGFTRSGERVVGDAARALAEELPEHVAYATKRFIGRRWTSELATAAKAVVPYPLISGSSGEIRIKVAGRVLPITQVSAMILGELRLDAQAYFGRPVGKAVITVPANFDDSQRTATKEAARIAGIEALRIINEPTAAAVAYGLTSSFQGRALVFDLGGGTFDVSILEVENGVFEVKATGGDPQLGGEDFDNRIVQWLIAQVAEPFRDAVAKDKLSLQHLKTAAERAKRDLTDKEETIISVADLGDHVAGGKKTTEIETALTRAFFHTLSEPLSRRCLDVCQRTMKEAKVDPKSMDAVLLVGGMTRVPLVRWLVADFFGKEPVGGVNPEEVVALGAAVHANELGQKGGAALLIDVASHSLGVGVLGGKVRRIVAKNTAIPVVARETFFPARMGQTNARIPVYQGESEYADENAKLGEVVLHDLNVINRSDTPIEVAFELSNEGTLSVRATDLTTGLAEAIRVEARTDLKPGEVDKLSKQESDYAVAAGAKDSVRAAETFKRVLDKAEKLARLLAKSAEENKSPEADAAVAGVRSLIDLGRAALKSQDQARMAEIARTIEKLAGAKP
jgi:molecular chaperone DnaK